MSHDVRRWRSKHGAAGGARPLTRAEVTAQLDAFMRAYGPAAARGVEVGLASASPELLELCTARSIKCMVMHCPAAPDPAGFREIIAMGTDMVNLDDASLFLRLERGACARPNL
jgi:hypothetical protein